ncbi:MAG: hypothetical protein K2H38_12780 [Muribaculaceae bacterium]|nr:hypothetical protein [Muribaculaceae bacterium]
MIRKGFKVKSLPIKYYASIKPEAACHPVQEYDVLSGEFYPERTGIMAVPLELTPAVGYTDPNTGVDVPNAAAMLTNGHWYRFDNTSGSGFSATAEITSGSAYTIDTVAGSATYGKIIIKENVDPGNPVTYVFIATLNPVNGEPVLVSARWQSRTRAIERQPVFSLDNAREVLYNPWEDADEFSINPVLKPSIPGAVFAWESLHDSVWGPLGSTLLDWAVDKVGDGIKIKRSVMQDRLDLRCTVQYTLGGKSHSDSLTVTMTRRLPKYWEDFVGVGNILPDTKSISPRAVIETAKGVLDDPKGELDIRWYNSADSVVGSGMQPVIPISSLGSTMEIGLDVQDTGGWKALVDDDGSFIVDDDGSLIIVK